MTSLSLARFAVLVGLVLSLAGCVDATVDIKLTSPTTAQALVTEVMGAQFYAMVKPAPAKVDPKSGMIEEPAEPNPFCVKGKLTEKSDGSAICVIYEEGAFDSLTFGATSKLAVFTPAGPGLVRISVSTAALVAELGTAKSADEETRQMHEAFFSGHSLTLKFEGLDVTDTNMTLADDKTSAQQVIQFLDLINGPANLPPELFAVVRVQ